MFSMVAFLSYGIFWLTLCFVLIVPPIGKVLAPSHASLGWYLFIWGVFSVCMFVGTLKKSPWALVFVFFTVVVLFFLLAAFFWTGNPKVEEAAGIEGVVCGTAAIYVAFGQILNDIYGRTILPLGKRGH